MNAIRLLLTAIVTVLYLGVFAGSAQAGRENNPMAECLACGEALLLCGGGVLTEAFQCVETCGGPPACVEVCREDAKAGADACKISYTSCKEANCPDRPRGPPDDLPGGRP